MPAHHIDTVITVVHHSVAEPEDHLLRTFPGATRCRRQKPHAAPSDVSFGGLTETLGDQFAQLQGCRRFIMKLVSPGLQGGPSRRILAVRGLGPMVWNAPRCWE